MFLFFIWMMGDLDSLGVVRLSISIEEGKGIKVSPHHPLFFSF